MTFREKFHLDYPTANSEYIINCPVTYGYETIRGCSFRPIRCTECWDREIPGTEDIKPEEPSESPVDSRKKRRQKEFDSWAEDMRMMYKALRNAGFDPSEAVTLVNNALLSSAVNNLTGSKRRG